MFETICLIGQTVPSGGQPQQSNPMVFFVGIALFMMVFFFISSRSSRKEKQKKQQMIENLAKNDRVMTIGGILGTVVSVKDNEVIVKVDESTNTRMTFLKRAIQQVITGDDKPSLDERT
ncbi:MAG: preprotein translocase subunit YajC [Phycisphaerales bacterium]|nr:preprotein translocase subunit YajC [Phycisphaerales bacterium]